eukprot:6205360-Pleurochrysis_carterae.AAC.2
MDVIWLLGGDVETKQNENPEYPISHNIPPGCNRNCCSSQWSEKSPLVIRQDSYFVERAGYTRSAPRQPSVHGDFFSAISHQPHGLAI